MRPVIGILWRNGQVKAWRIEADGTISDRLVLPLVGGAADPGRAGHCIESVRRHWPDVPEIWASGMPELEPGGKERFCDAPVTVEEIALRCTETVVQGATLHLVPSLICTAPHGAPDMMGSEVVDLCGYLALPRTVPLRRNYDDYVLLPGTQSKWVQCREDRIIGFFTSLGGTIYDLVTAHGPLAAICQGKGPAGPVFDAACVRAQRSDLGIAALLFEAHAQASRLGSRPGDAASHIRGLMVGGELADAFHNYPFLSNGKVMLIGEESLCALFARALGQVGIGTAAMPQEACSVAGIRALASAQARSAARAA